MSRFAGMLGTQEKYNTPLSGDAAPPTSKVARAGMGTMRPESTPFQMKYNKSSFPFKGSPTKDMKTGKYKQKFEN